MRLKTTPYDIPLLFFFLSAVISIGVGYDPSLGWQTLLTLGAGCILFLVLSRRAYSARAWQAAAGLLTALAGILSIYFVTQAGHLGYEDKVDLLARVAAAISSLMPDINIWKPFPNSVATFLEGCLFLSIGLSLSVHHKNRRWMLMGVSLVIALALIFSSSRGAWLAALAAGLIWISLYWRPARYLVFAAAGGLFALIIYILIQGDITAINQIPIVNTVLGPLFIRPDRLEVYRNSLALIGDVPFSGIGLGEQFALVYSHYELLIQVPFLYYSHNLLLEVWLQQGLLGIASWIALMVSVYVWAWTTRHTIRDLRFESTWIGLTAIYLHGVTDARQYQDLWCWLPFFTLLGLNAALLATAPVPLKRPLQRLLPAGTAALLILIVCIRFWPFSASIGANTGAILEQRADLNPQLADSERAALHAQADTRYQQVLSQQPENRTANQRLGFDQFNQYRFDSAIPHLQRALQAYPLNPGTRKALGLAYTFSGDLARAAPLLADLPKIIDELNQWGWYLSNNQHTPEAQNAYRLSLQLSPNQPEVKKAILKLQNH